MPKGGGAVTGMAESFQAAGFTGFAEMSIDFEVTGCRDFAPDLSVDYSSGNGNGIFGQGFDLSLPSITRRPDLGVPRYQDSDPLVCSDVGEIVPGLVNEEGVWVADERPVKEKGTAYRVRTFQPRVQTDFTIVERWTEEKSGSVHWRTISADNVLSLYGSSCKSQLADPTDPSRVFKWLIDESRNANGDRIIFEYKAENSQSVPASISATNRAYTNRYPSRIFYGNYPDSPDEWAFEIAFDYGEFDAEYPSTPDTEWTARPDFFSSYRSGFEIRTSRLCHRMLLFHRFPVELGEPRTLIRELKFTYDENPTASRLVSAQEMGYASYPGIDAVVTEKLPALNLEYSPFQPERATFQPIELVGGTSISGDLGGSSYRLIDYFGVGMPGIEYSSPQEHLYWRPLGNGVFQGPLAIDPLPAAQFTGNGYLADLDGNGLLEWVIPKVGQAGVYPRDAAGYWKSFQAFKSSPTSLDSDEFEKVDLNGSGHVDLIQIKTDILTTYTSIGLAGFIGPDERLNLNGTPSLDENTPNSAVLFADLIGDGGEHRIRIRSGQVECWPNLGHGNFGAPYSLEGAPVFGPEFTASQLYLADLDGSGPNDLIYACADRVEVYLNQSGNSFAQPLLVPLPGSYVEPSQITFADVTGNGTLSLVFSTAGPNVHHYYYDFCPPPVGDTHSSAKPYLLRQIINNTGGITRIRYASSTRFLLDDQMEGRSWPTLLPFASQVVERVESFDAVSHSKLTRRFRYHDGYYDTVERVFRGFGYVESWDAEDFDEPISKSLFPESEPATDLRSIPAYRCSWYHTGAYTQEGSFSRAPARDYFRDDRDAHELPDSVFVDQTESTSAEAAREAAAALAGQLLRQEVFGLDGDPKQGVPYSVQELTYAIRSLQPPIGASYGSYLVLTREQIDSIYDRVLGDPQIEHSFRLKNDPFGNPNLIATVFYPRRAVPDVLDSQRNLRVRAAVKSFINIRHDGNLVGVPCVEQEFEIGGLKLGDEKYFAFADIECLVETALNNPIPNGEQLPSGEVAALLLSWQESYYWNDTQTAPLPLGEATPRALIHHAAEAVFSDQTLKRLFEDSGHAVSEDILTNEGGYVHDRGYWWNNDLTAYYGKASVFFQLISARDQFGGLTAQQFDPYALFPVRVIDAEDYSVLIVNDYRTAAPTKIIDANGNVTEVLFDPLGRVFVFSMHGHIGDEPEGDLPLSEYVVRFPPSREALLCDPHDYLQGATAYYYEDTLAWNQPHPEPIYSITVTREIHQHDLVIGEQSPVIFDIEFDDSFGMTVQRKTGVPAEILPEPLGKLVLSHAAECGPPLWLTSGTVVYDNSGNIVQRYEPFFISDPTFTADPSITHVGVTDTTHYDPLGRIIRVDKSTTFFELRYYSSWAYQKLDVDDNVTESAFYRERICDLNPDFADERDALLKAAVFHDTPTTCHFDNLGNVCAITRIKVILKEIRERCGEIPPKPPEFDRVLAPLTTVTERDIEGNLISASDPRLGPKGLNNLRRVYDMMDRVLYNWSCDSGERWVLTNAVGNQFRVWDGRGFETATTFDTMQRPTLVEVTRSGHTFVAEVTEYGTDPELNQRGQIALVCDEAGVLQAGPYDLSGLLLSSERRFCEDYLSPPDWSSPEIRMQSEPYTVASTYDALGRLLRQENADGTAIVRSYFPPGWLSTVSLESEGTVQPLLDSVSYNSKGQRRIAVTAGGTVRNTCEYEPLTFRLSSVETIRLTDGRKLQDINYTYDPIGNVTRIEDRSAEHILHQQSSASPRFDYTYDALYRIVQATGREYPNLPEQAYREGFKQSGFVSLSESPPLSLRGYKQTFHYDYGDNLVQMDHEGDVDWSRKVVVSDTSNRAVPNQMIESGKSPDDFFDHNGNMASLEFIGEIDWSYRNLIYHSRSAREPSARVDSYSAYNAAGGRARHVVADDGREPTVEDTITIGDLEITTVSSGDTIRSRRLRLVVQADDGCVAEQITTLAADTDDDVAQVELRYQYSSELGSIVLELSENGDVLSYEEFFPFGGSSVIAGPNEETVRPKKYRYSGQGCDDATGLYNYGLRYYVSWMGRWPSPDPAGPVDGLNIYVFIRSNPSSSVDEGGLIQCSICGKTGHNKSNQAFHPKGSTAKLAKRYLSIGTFAGKAAKHGATLQGNAKKNITQVFVKKRKDGKTYTVYIGVIQKNLRKHPIDAANYMEDQMHEKTVRASALLASEAEKAIIKSPIHEKPSSQQFAKLDWKRTFGDDPMPMNPNGKTVNLRAAGERLAPSPAGLVDYKGRPLVKAVDELVGRGEGGSGSHAKSPLNPTELGQNQWWMDNTANSQMGAADVQILAAAKKDHLVFGVSRIMEYRLRILT